MALLYFTIITIIFLYFYFYISVGATGLSNQSHKTVTINGGVQCFIILNTVTVKGVKMGGNYL